MEKNNKVNEVKFKNRKNDLVVRFDGKVFAVLGKEIGKLFKNDQISNARLNYIGYTTKRDGETIRYQHDFKEHARPQMRSSTSNIIKSFGGRFEFTERGFVDLKKS